MHEIKRYDLDSLSLFVGTGQCNANCAHCAGVPLRRYAPSEDGVIDVELVYKSIKTCYDQGARYLSLTSCGEPTLSPLSVTKTLELIYGCREEGIEFSPLNLYSNGIRIGEEKDFCDAYLHLWKDLGLTTIYITVHSADEVKNAKIYGIERYPSLNLVLSRIHDANLLIRANLVLSKQEISTFDKFVSTIGYLKIMGIDSISAWPIKDKEDKVDPKLSPLEEELDRMEKWVEENQDTGPRIRLLRGKNRAENKTDHKLILFPDGTLSDEWCNH